MRNNFRFLLVRLATKHYRIIKTYLLTKHPPILTPIFFLTVGVIDGILSGRKLNPAEQASKQLWKQAYHQYYSEHVTQRISIQTENPVAYSTDDHKHPRGSLFDNSTNPRFNAQIYRLFEFRENIRLLDLGCAGGGMVKSFLEDGHFAVGIEGSDVSRRLRSGEWDTIPFHLFTSDITKPFQLMDNKGVPVEFDVVTAWEVLEHIPEESLAGLINNIFKHLKQGGYFFCSIDLLPDGNPLMGAVYHKTLQSKAWWKKRFTEWGFAAVVEHGFSVNDMVRGNGSSLKDWHPDDGGGMHLVFRKS